MKAVDAGQREHVPCPDQVVGAGEPQKELGAHGLGDHPVHEVSGKPVLAVQQEIQTHAGKQHQQVKEQQQARLGDAFVAQVGRRHGKGRDTEVLEKAVGAALEVHGERVGFSVLDVDVVEYYPIAQRQVGRQAGRQPASRESRGPSSALLTRRVNSRL